jgi:hypothetical protein
VGCPRFQRRLAIRTIGAEHATGALKPWRPCGPWNDETDSESRIPGVRVQARLGALLCVASPARKGRATAPFAQDGSEQDHKYLVFNYTLLHTPFDAVGLL